MNFELGNVVLTYGVSEAIKSSMNFEKEIIESLTRHCNKDWGELSGNDRAMNEEALLTGDQIFSAYTTSKGKIYIITEYDRSITTVLFCSEY